ncbi:MAG TPA: dephospho-CoA kinase [Terrimesophilobacter sp.]|nr:dephospho-CoA kinase [Terrimesophilobacter sp.]
MYLIAVTGGIASGKSVVSARLAEHGAIHIDADELARRAVEPGAPALAAIAEHFGEGVIRPDGTLDRAALGTIIFADPDEREALNAITHPAVKQLARGIMERAEAVDPDVVIVYDVPLFIEARVNEAYDFDLVVVVHASVATRIDRMMKLRGLTIDEAKHRVNSQVGDTQRLAIADVVIDTNGTLAETIEQTDQLWRTISRRRSR